MSIRDYAPKVALLSLLAGCADNSSSSIYSPVQSRPRSDSRSYLSKFLINLPIGSNLLIGYDAFDSTPFNPERPNESYLPAPSVGQLKKELGQTSDNLRKVSLERSIEIMTECERNGVPYHVVRVARNEVLGSGVGRVHGIKPTDVVYTMADRIPISPDLERVGNGYSTSPTDNIRQHGYPNNKLVEFKWK